MRPDLPVLALACMMGALLYNRIPFVLFPPGHQDAARPAVPNHQGSKHGLRAEIAGIPFEASGFGFAALILCEGAAV